MISPTRRNDIMSKQGMRRMRVWLRSPEKRTCERLELLQGNGCLDIDERYERENEAWDGNQKVFIDTKNVR
jgi:hypothetical protein